MKLRHGFVTNSSSSFYMVHNTTDRTKTMLDLLAEAAAGDWYLVEGRKYTKGSNHRESLEGHEPNDYESRQEFLEAVRSLEIFPPHTIHSIAIAWGDGGPIHSKKGLYSRKTESFEIEYIPM